MSIPREVLTNTTNNSGSTQDVTNIAVEVFRTSIESEDVARRVLEEISKSHPEIKANFDLEDVDNILRIENCSNASILSIVHLVEKMGFTIEVLPE